MLTKKQLIDRWKIEPWNGLVDEFAAFTSERGEIYVQANNFGGKPLDKINLNRFIQKLAGLPGSEEIGRFDFRGSTFAGGVNLILDNVDFSFCPSFIGLTNCEARGMHVSSIPKAIYDLTGRYTDCTFNNSNFKKTILSDSVFNNCNFSGARMHGASLQRSEFHYCNFEDADLSDASFIGAKLIGCSLRGADLSGSILKELQIDNTTDFRGAKLFDLIDDNKALWRKGVWDETTKVGSDPTVFVSKYLKAIITASKHVRDPWGEELRNECKNIITELNSNSNISVGDIENRLTSRFQVKGGKFGDIMSEAAKLV